MASTRPEEKIEYLCDFSRDYYNLLERTVNGEKESFIYDNNVVSMSKSGNNYYYLQDELGSPMYMTGTDGVAVSSYAFDDFGKNIDPRTGKQRKHEYKAEGNIIQPFAFTGYQEDEVSGLKFAQARFYDASTGRFQSEDNVKGFVNVPFTMNHYGYCFGNPVGLVDNDGNWPKWVTDAADAVGDTVNKATKAVSDGAKKAVNAAGEFYQDHKEIINATLITAAAVTVTVATCGAGAALAVGALSVAGGTAFGVNSVRNGGSFEKGFARGMADTSVALASFAANPGGAILGFGGQVVADCINHKVSSPETYASAFVGGAISNSGIMFGNTLGGVAGSVTNDLLSNSVAGGNISGRQMLKNAGIAGAVGLAFDVGVGFGKSFVPGYIKSGLDSILHPFNFGRVVDGRNILSIIDDFGRAAFGLNGGSNIIVNYLDVYLTGEALDCGQ